MASFTELGTAKVAAPSVALAVGPEGVTGNTEAPPAGTAAASASAVGAAAGGAISAVAGLVPSTEVIKARLGSVWSESRPWAEFGNLSQMARPEVSEVVERVQENGRYYQMNYLLILVVLGALTILTSPLSFLGGFCVLVAYVYLFVVHPEPLRLGGVDLDSKAKAVMMVLLSVAALWVTGAGATFTSLIVVVGVIALAHAAVRRPAGPYTPDRVPGRGDGERLCERRASSSSSSSSSPSSSSSSPLSSSSSSSPSVAASPPLPSPAEPPM